MRIQAWLFFCLLVAPAAWAQTHRMPSMRTPSGGRMICAKCEVPAKMTNSAVLTPVGEPGEAMEISGTIYEKDGKTPAPNVVMFVYHTDATGHYCPEDDPFAPRLKGYVKTGADGHYSFRSIRPAPYPNHSEPAHIHIQIWSDSTPEHFIQETWFAGDPLIKAQDVVRHRGLGTFSPIVELTRGKDGVWRGVRDIRLEE